MSAAPSSSGIAERDYVLGTHDEEVHRLGLQHRVWRPTVLDCWQRCGIGAGSRVLDVGAGPGYATLDLAEIVGPAGRVAAVERSGRFAGFGRAACAARGLAQAEFHELDLMTDPLPPGSFDASWCRWVAAFVSSPELLVQKLAAALRPGGLAIFHEYGDYQTWRFAPRRAPHEEFVQQVMRTWRASGGEPDVAPALLPLLARHGFRVREAVPRVFCVRPRDPMWRWPAAFVEIGIDRLVALGAADPAWAAAAKRDFAAAEADPETRMLTPLVLEIVAERLGAPAA